MRSVRHRQANCPRAVRFHLIWDKCSEERNAMMPRHNVRGITKFGLHGMPGFNGIPGDDLSRAHYREKPTISSQNFACGRGSSGKHTFKTVDSSNQNRYAELNKLPSRKKGLENDGNGRTPEKSPTGKARAERKRGVYGNSYHRRLQEECVSSPF